MLRLVAGARFRSLTEVIRGGATQRRALLHQEMTWREADRWIVAEGIGEWVEDKQRRGREGLASDSLAT